MCFFLAKVSHRLFLLFETPLFLMFLEVKLFVTGQDNVRPINQLLKVKMCHPGMGGGGEKCKKVSRTI